MIATAAFSSGWCSKDHQHDEHLGWPEMALSFAASLTAPCAGWLVWVPFINITDITNSRCRTTRTLMVKICAHKTFKRVSVESFQFFSFRGDLDDNRCFNNYKTGVLLALAVSMLARYLLWQHCFHHVLCIFQTVNTFTIDWVVTFVSATTVIVLSILSDTAVNKSIIAFHWNFSFPSLLFRFELRAVLIQCRLFLTSFKRLFVLPVTSSGLGEVRNEFFQFVFALREFFLKTTKFFCNKFFY